MWNCRLMEHNRAPMGTVWSRVNEFYSDRAAVTYCKSQIDLWKPGDAGRVEVAEDGFVGEPRLYDVRMESNGNFSVRLDD